MKPFVGIIGHSSSGKSTIIQSLTGCPKRTGIQFVEDEKTGREILVIASSPQEDKVSNENFLNELKAAARRKATTGAVVAMRPSNGTKRLKMESMVEEAEKLGFGLRLYVLDPPRSSAKRTADLAEIKRRLPGHELTLLDARRFAHLNSAQIAKAASLLH